MPRKAQLWAEEEITAVLETASRAVANAKLNPSEGTDAFRIALQLASQVTIEQSPLAHFARPVQ